jgi:hypothetical protein
MTREECTLTRDKLDVCGRELLILGDNGQIFPENSRQLRDHCRRIHESMNCINNYADNCLKIFSKKYIKYLVYKTSEIVSVRCSSKSENLIRLAPCLNKVWYPHFSTIYHKKIQQKKFGLSSDLSFFLTDFSFENFMRF